MGSDSKSNGSGGGGAAAGAGGGGGGGGGQIPPSSKKVVQDLKEIVNNNCTDSEIYAALRDCNMDPNEAVQRLLSQDTFHEVKSRRERRKEMKETQEPKSWSNYGTSNRGVRGGNEHSLGWSGSVKTSSNELGKAAYRKANGSVASIANPASSTVPANVQTWNEQPSTQSNSFNADNRRQSSGTGDMIDSSLQPSHGSQSAWTGATTGHGHVTMADIVKMGRPQSKGSQMPCETSYTTQDVPTNTAIYQLKTSHASSHPQSRTHHDFHSSDWDMPLESGKKSNLHDFGNEWPVIEPMTDSSDIGAAMYSDQSYLQSNNSYLSGNCWSDNIIVSESNSTGENLSSNHVSSTLASSKQIFINGSRGKFRNDDDMSKNTSSLDSYRQIYEHQEGTDTGSNISASNSTASLSDDVMKAVSSATMNLQQLSLGKEEPAMTRREENHGVVLPDYLQAFSADCSHLSFGTYKSGKSIASSQPQPSSAMTNDLGGTFTASDGLSSMHSNSRNSFYHDGEHTELDFDAHRAISDARNYGSRKSSVAELRKLDIPDVAENGTHHVSHSFMTAPSLKNIQQPSSALPFVINPNARNLPSFPIEVQPYSNTTPSDLGVETFESLKARDSAASQSTSSRYSSTASSIKNPTTSMSEVLNSGVFSVSHPPSQALHVANLATRPVLKEHLSAQSYSQSGYAAIPQAHTYTPSVLQQAYPEGNLFHEPLAGMKYNLPQYRSASMTSLPLSGSYASGYESSGNGTNIPGNFLHNPSAGGAGRKVGYDDYLTSQYRDVGSNFNLLRQNDGSALWDYGRGSRNISTLPNGAYNGLQGQNSHHLAGYQQSLPHTQLHEVFRYPGIYNYQPGITREQQQQQQQNLHDMFLNGSQSPSSRQLPQIWQQSY